MFLILSSRDSYRLNSISVLKYFLLFSEYGNVSESQRIILFSIVFFIRCFQGFEIPLNKRIKCRPSVSISFFHRKFLLILLQMSYSPYGALAPHLVTSLSLPPNSNIFHFPGTHCYPPPHSLFSHWLFTSWLALLYIFLYQFLEICLPHSQYMLCPLETFQLYTVREFGFLV